MADNGEQNGDGNPVVLNHRQEACANLLASGASITEVAKQVKVAERSVYSWLAEIPQFKMRIAETRGRILDQTVGLLATAACEATLTLVALLKDKAPNIRLRAASSILENCIRVREHAELDARLLAIERAADARELEQVEA